MTMIDYPDHVIAAQPMGYWTDLAGRTIIGAIRAQLAVEQLTQPHWWILNHVSGSPGVWTHTTLARRLDEFAEAGTDLGAVVDDLVGRGWLRVDETAGTLTLTDEGEAGRLRAHERNATAHQTMREGVPTEDYVATVNVLRRMVANLDGRTDLP
ncbi:MarR family winged helix-turn-helix transcriptional regulator [Speluncibacter jeojiensis]|uniref:MarR family winged helix-turn-helix transcriptional regulator n=1 Tax=Speluncibacter jeojiensis TaxID=2710754 RepID=A0A9X4M2N8_9ACTN|nr:MarR family winged helix-turn-helix transcriptional regulator [Corynebacteriales bacterium D3-21]